MRVDQVGGIVKRLRRALRYGGAALATAAAMATSADAQTRVFTVCFTEGVQSCSRLELTTTAFYLGPDRIGTAIDVLVQHQEGAGPTAAVTSALGGFFFSYAGATVAPTAGANVSDELAMVAPLFFVEFPTSAPDPLNPDGWRHMARSSTTASASPLFDNYVSFINVLGVFDGSSGMIGTQFIGGCGVAGANGLIDAIYTTEVWTCGDGTYRFSTFTDAWFDVDFINAVGVTTYARFAEQEYGVAAFCTQFLDTNTSEGDAYGTFEMGDVCATPDATTVAPEPATAVLLLAGLCGVGVVARRRRGVVHCVP